MLSGYKIIIEQDTNPSSLSYGQTRQRRVFSEETCPPGTDVAQWEMTNQYCEMVDRMRNGYLVTIYTDVNEDSATYNQTRTERVMDATTCPIDTTNPNWQNTGEAYCEQILYTPGNVYGNSGYEIQIQTDVNEFSSTYNQTLFDSYVNLLRSQTEAMSAALGSVHSMVVTPFDAPYEEATDFSERIARNQQLLIKEEAHFDRIVDPSAGSYYIEHLTDALAQEAWKIFLKVEEEGGFLAAVKAGTIQDDINATNVKRHGDAAKRKEFLLGTNQFPNFTE